MQMIGFARLGRDAEVRHTAAGDAVASLSLAFNYGRKDDGGKRPTQWVDGSLWGKRAEALAPYLKKGGGVVVTLDDPHIEEFEGRNGAGYKLAARVSEIELVGGRDDAPTQRQAPAPASAAAKPAAPASMADDDIPF